MALPSPVITLDKLAQDYARARPRSAALHAKATGFFPARGATHFARIQTPFRPYIGRAAGSRKWDVDGIEYVDYTMGHGALMLGHSHPAIVAAIQEQAAKGLHYGDNHPLEVEWAQWIRRLMPAAERIAFCASGQEANMMALRLARAVTGRRKILRTRGSYHGWADELTTPDGPGVVADQVTLVEPGDLSLVERALATKEFAAVLLEGGGGYLAGRVPANIAHHKAMPELASRHGTLLVLDEVVTGFREAPGGWQSVVGITPDLTTIGKAVSGGLASGAVFGRPELLEPLDPFRPGRAVLHGGTWNAVPITCAAGIAACALYEDGSLQRVAREKAEAVRDGCNDAMERRGVSGRLYGRSALHVYFGPVDTPRDSDSPLKDVAQLLDPAISRLRGRLDLHLLHRGVATFRGEVLMFSGVHTDEDVEKTVEAFDQSVAAMQAEGTFKGL